MKQSEINQNKIKTYLIPGVGADYRLFSKLILPNSYEPAYIELTTLPAKFSTKDYAGMLSQQINTDEDFILLGVSIGGMIATELSELVRPRLTILISSAKCRSELPFHYRIMKFLPIHSIVPSYIYKIGAQIAQPLIEPDRKHGKKVFKAMLKAKDPVFLKRASKMIINWDRKTPPNEIIHIHGDNDHTIPVKNVKADYIIKNGSHMMILTKSKAINTLLEKILSSSQ